MLSLRETISAFKKGSFHWRHILTMAPLVDIAQDHEAASEFNKAVQIWKRLYKNRFRRLQGGLNLIRLSRQSHFDGDVTSIIEVLKKEFPDQVSTWLESAKYYYDNQDFQSALEDFEKTVLMRPDIKPAVNQYAKCVEETSQQERAYKVIKQAISKDPSSSHLFYVFVRLAKNADDEGLQNFLDEHYLNLDKEDLEPILTGVVSLERFVLSHQMKIMKKGKFNPIDIEHRKEVLEDPIKMGQSWHQNKLAQKIHEASLATESKKTQKQNPKKILLVTEINWNFMRPIAEAIENDEEFELRTLELSKIQFPEELSPDTLLGRHVLLKEDGIRMEGGYYWQDQIDWADEIFVEWTNRAAIWISWFIPPEKRLVIRIHSYEAFSAHPFLINWGNVDAFVSVSPHILSFVSDLCRLDRYQIEKQVIPNLNFPQASYSAKEAKVACSIGMIGYNNKNKNAIMGLEIIDQLRANGVELRLYLMGHPFDDEEDDPVEVEYRSKFEAYLKDKKLESLIEYIPFNPNIDEGIKYFNFILSTSLREGTHESLIQAMLRSTVPVIRKWPILSQYKSAENIYSSEWIFKDSSEMAGFIKNVLDRGSLNELQLKAKEEAESNYGYENVWRQYRALLKG